MINSPSTQVDSQQHGHDGAASPPSGQRPPGSSVVRSSRPVTRLELAWFRRLLKSIGSPPLSIRFWDGQQIDPPGKASVARILIGDRGTLWKLALDPLYQFGEAYAAGRLHVEGELVEALSVIFRVMNDIRLSPGLSAQAARLLMPRRGSSQRKSRHNIHHHYDIGNDFYKLWLDEQMVYTCAYYERPEMLSLERAQRAKMDHVCRKLWLQPGEAVVEAGCGWGALAIHMAKHYGVRVKAFNISREQVAYARQRAAREGLEGRVEFIEDDWRNIRERCDAFVSVGMLEHVALRNYQELGGVIDRCLPDDGRGLIHSIGQNSPQPMNAWIERRIFPGAQTPALSEITRIFEPHNLSVLDVENLRLHYRTTLIEWLRRFEQVRDQVRDQFGEQFVRIWRLYLAGSAAAFDSGSMQLFQVVFAKPVANQIPWTRAHQYDGAARPATGPELPSGRRPSATG